ncbi:MAG: hypothetical protein LBG19_13325 [Prevotellaceae bacterium]|jgi:hypothetical protein|nr:hypothetical protein [Prevotellaceae bacterium]
MDEKQIEPIDQTEFLTDEMLDEIEAGGCTSCEKACQPGNQNAGNINDEKDSVAAEN